MFVPFPSLTRFSQDWTVTEKIDGSNAQIWIDALASADDKPVKDAYSLGYFQDDFGGLHIVAGSRKRFLKATKQEDHMGFAQWVFKNAASLVKTLGPGRHFGEWWGQGIQRGYDLKEKRFSLFNVSRWKEENVSHVPGLHVVPVVEPYRGVYLNDPGFAFFSALEQLKREGSLAAPGYMNPEGIVMFHGRSGTGFKKTFDYDEEGKWAEKHEKGEKSEA
jgi:hypothetical protein